MSGGSALVVGAAVALGAACAAVAPERPAREAASPQPASVAAPLPSGSDTAAPFLPELLLREGAWTLTPTLSPDGRLLAFVRWARPRFAGPDSNIQQLYLSRRARDGAWETPRVVEAFAAHRVDYPHFSPDGRWLYLSSTRPHPGHYGFPDVPYEDFDLWRVPLAGDTLRWAAAELVPCADCRQRKTPANWNVRYVANETNPRLDAAGRLYFWTERAGTGGLRDVYASDPLPGDAGFGPERRLPFNTPARESGVAVTRDGGTVVFASEGLGGSGGSDLFRVDRLPGGGWSAPRSLGPRVNSRYDEGGPELVGDTLLLFTSGRPAPGYTGADAGEGRLRLSVWGVEWGR